MSRLFLSRNIEDGNVRTGTAYLQPQTKAFYRRTARVECARTLADARSRVEAALTRPESGLHGAHMVSFVNSQAEQAITPELGAEPSAQTEAEDTAVEDQWEVERLLARRVRSRARGSRAAGGGGRATVEYLVRWAGYSAEDDTWQTRADLRTAKEAIDAFERQRKVQLPPEQTPAAGVKIDYRIYVPRGVAPPQLPPDGDGDDDEQDIHTDAAAAAGNRSEYLARGPLVRPADVKLLRTGVAVWVHWCQDSHEWHLGVITQSYEHKSRAWLGWFRVRFEGLHDARQSGKPKNDVIDLGSLAQAGGLRWGAASAPSPAEQLPAPAGTLQPAPSPPPAAAAQEAVAQEEKGTAAAAAAAAVREGWYSPEGLLRYRTIGAVRECSAASCAGCGAACPNRVLQRGVVRKLEVFYTGPQKGWGIRSAEDLPAGAFLAEYVGEIRAEQRNGACERLAITSSGPPLADPLNSRALLLLLLLLLLSMAATDDSQGSRYVFALPDTRPTTG
jgi:hypothetical protein